MVLPRPEHDEAPAEPTGWTVAGRSVLSAQLPRGQAMTSSRIDPRAPTMRGLWRLIETCHAPVYFAPEAKAVFDSIGLRDPDMAYFASRTAPLGIIDPGIAAACLYVFASTKVSRHLPLAWSQTSPEDSLAARLEVFDRACKKMVGPLTTETAVSACGRLLADLVAIATPNGRPLFAANATTPRPASGHLELFWAVTALREYRGDAHNVALQSAAVTPVESHIIMRSLGLVPNDQATSMGWTQPQQRQAQGTLRERGWLTPSGHLSKEGRRERARIEHETDRLSAEALTPLGERGTAEATHVLSAMASKFITAGAVPYPNRSGVAPAAELGVLR